MNVEQVADLLGGTSTCQDLSREDLRAVVRIGTVRSEPEGTDLMREGEPGSSMALLLDGEVKVLKTDGEGEVRELATLGPGTLLGEMAMLERMPRTATVRAATSVGYLEIEREAFDALVEAESPVAARMIRALAQALCRRQRETNDRLVELLAQATQPGGGGAPHPVELIEAQVIEVDF